MNKACIALLILLLSPLAALAGEKNETPWRVATAFYVGAVAADMYSTDMALGRCTTCYEANPLFNGRPSDARLYLQGAAISTGIWLWARQIRKTKPRTAMTLLIVFTVLHGAAAYHNAGIGR